jgi:hypothetical protein
LLYHFKVRYILIAKRHYSWIFCYANISPFINFIQVKNIGLLRICYLTYWLFWLYFHWITSLIKIFYIHWTQIWRKTLIKRLKVKRWYKIICKSKNWVILSILSLKFDWFCQWSFCRASIYNFNNFFALKIITIFLSC